MREFVSDNIAVFLRIGIGLNDHDRTVVDSHTGTAEVGQHRVVCQVQFESLACAGRLVAFFGAFFAGLVTVAAVIDAGTAGVKIDRVGLDLVQMDTCLGQDTVGFLNGLIDLLGISRVFDVDDQVDLDQFACIRNDSRSGGQQIKAEH